jgi:hypothetical protein
MFFEFCGAARQTFRPNASLAPKNTVKGLHVKSTIPQHGLVAFRGEHLGGSPMGKPGGLLRRVRYR